MNGYIISTMVATMLIMPILLMTLPATVHAKQVCQKTILYSLTSHPQKESTVLCHPTGKDLVKANDANILFNKGIVAAQHSSLTQCPNSDKSFCSGWDWEKKYG
jgi:hypothetical protein